jgi:hypothetical protein
MELNPDKLKSIGLEGYKLASDMMILVNNNDEYAVVKVSGEDIEQVDVMKSNVENDKMDKDMENDKMDHSMDKKVENDKMDHNMDKKVENDKMDHKMKESIKSMIDEAMKGYMKKMENEKAKEVENNKSEKLKQEKELAKIQIKRTEMPAKTQEAKQENLIEKYKNYIVKI